MNENQKFSRYKRITDQLTTLLADSPTITAKFATINAVLYHKFTYMFWVGFYIYSNNQLIVGPYQGPLACQKLEYNKGVCWKSVNEKQSIAVPNVEEFPGHIACDSRSKSEIVIPVFDKEKEIIAVLDIDSDKLNAFSETDEIALNKLVKLI